MKRPIDRYVESLLRRRRPASFTPAEDDIAIARAAIDLAAAAPDAQRPRAAFVEDLRRRLADQQDAAEPSPAPALGSRSGERSRSLAALSPATSAGSAGTAEAAGPLASAASAAAQRIRGRRHFLTATALTATGVAAGVAVDRAVTGSATPATGADHELTPTTGTWQTVAEAADLPEGAVLPFDLGAVTGFIRRSSGRIQAVSGICTHQGCRLHLDTPATGYVCPCHGATFSPSGAPLTRPHGNSPLPALPRLAVRIEGGSVQVYAPNQA